MAFKLTPPVFRREVERRLMDVHAVTELYGLSRRTLLRRVRAGTLPSPVISGGERRFSLWDRDEIEKHQPDMKEQS